MASPISNDLRERVVEAIEHGLTRRQAATKYRVSVASAVRWHQRYRRQQNVVPDRMGGDRRTERIEQFADTVADWIQEQPDLTLAEIQTKLSAQGESFALSTIWRLLDRHGYSVKKRRPMPTSKSARMLLNDA